MKKKHYCLLALALGSFCSSCTKGDLFFEFAEDLMYEIATSSEYGDYVVSKSLFYNTIKDANIEVTNDEDASDNTEMTAPLSNCIEARQRLFSRFPQYETMTYEEKRSIAAIASTYNAQLSMLSEYKCFTRSVVDNPESIVCRAKAYLEKQYSDYTCTAHESCVDYLDKKLFYGKSCAFVFLSGTGEDPCVFVKLSKKDSPIPSLANFDSQPNMIFFSSSLDNNNVYSYIANCGNSNTIFCWMGGNQIF